MLFGRCKNLRSIDLWRGSELSGNGFLMMLGLDYNRMEEENRLMALPDDVQEDLQMIYSCVEMPFRIKTIEHLKYLQEIDFGWTQLPAGSIKHLVSQIGSSLIKIFLTACRCKIKFFFCLKNQNYPFVFLFFSSISCYE